MISKFAILIAVFATTTGLLSADTKKSSLVPEIRLPLMPKAPVVGDGTIDPQQWEDAARMERLGNGKKLVDQSASFWIGATKDGLYIALRSETAPGGKLLRRANAFVGENNPMVSSDDAVEIYIAPNPDAPASERRTYQGIFNANGASLSQLYTLNGGSAWIGKWAVANKVSDHHWDFQIFIPWKELGIEQLSLPCQMGIRVARSWKQTTNGGVQAEWSPLGGSYTSQATLPRVTWDSEAPVVQVIQLQDAPNEPVHIRMSLKNGTKRKQQLVITAEVTPENSAHTKRTKPITLLPGEQKEVDMGQSSSLPGETIHTAISVNAEASNTSYYERAFTWSLDRPDTLWNLNTVSEKHLELKYAYFPSTDVISVQLDAGEKAPTGKISVSLRRVESGDAEAGLLASTKMPPFQNGKSELTAWKIPTLDEGEYELTAAFEDSAIPPKTGRFVRHRFPWEGNQLGMTNVVVPPFLPITVSGQELNTVLRKHRINGIGLWEQVVADGEPLMKEPMRIEVALDGTVIQASGKHQFTAVADTEARSKAAWSAGPIQGTTDNQWDYDGTMKTVITLAPSTTAVDRLTLVVTLDDRLAPLLHACADGIRFNYSGKMPEGNGVIWKSDQAAHQSIIGNYVPYLWIGGPTRGLSVFGDNDAGWITAPGAISQEIVRSKDGKLELRLHLIQKNATWKEPLRITLGFLATPVKPMPDGWRLWSIGGSGKAASPGKYHQTFLGSCPYWGSVTRYQDLYPRDEDFSYFDALAAARKTGKQDQAFIDQWLAGYHLTGNEQKKKEQLDFYRRHVKFAFSAMANQPKGVLVYTNGRGVRFDTREGQTYLDEWHRFAFPKRTWAYGTGVSYDLDPVASYRDYAAWYWKEMLTRFTEGIYWDDVFLQSNFKPETSPAYLTEGGRIQPSSGVWNMRALVRRGMTLSHELGMPNRNMVHMTNTAIAPILGFASSALTWEDRGGDSDFQERFPRDYILAESTGRQFGTLPVALTSHIRGGNPEKVNWAYRTAAGVLLTHEMKALSRRGDPDHLWENYDRLVAFGYGQKEVTIYNYWDKDFPATLTGENSALLLVREGKALLVLCDWGTEGEREITLDANLLGAFEGKLTAHDLEDGTPFKVKDNTVVVSLKKHDFRLVLIEKIIHAP